jgi:hypothetical protein
MSKLSDERVLAEIKGHLDRASEWALPSDLAENEKGFSLINSIRQAVAQNRPGLALDRWGDLQDHRPTLSKETEEWTQ